MQERIATDHKTDIAGALQLWIGLLLPPAAWAMQMEALYLSSEYGCASRDFTWNHVVVVCGLVLSIIGLFTAWRQWSRSDSPSDDPGMSLRGFMSTLGMLSGALFTVTIIAQWLPTLTGVPCDK
jgi:hypothetical protein